MLYAFCQEFRVPHKRCRMLVVAMNAGEVDKLAAVKAQAETNGVVDLAWLSSSEALALKPALVAERALFSPSTGIIDATPSCWRCVATPRPLAPCSCSRRPVPAGRAGERGLVIETGGRAPARIVPVWS
jgi:hypothetical protein